MSFFEALQSAKSQNLGNDGNVNSSGGFEAGYKVEPVIEMGTQTPNGNTVYQPYFQGRGDRKDWINRASVWGPDYSAKDRDGNQLTKEQVDARFQAGVRGMCDALAVRAADGSESYISLMDHIGAGVSAGHIEAGQVTPDFIFGTICKSLAEDGRLFAMTAHADCHPDITPEIRKKAMEVLAKNDKTRQDYYGGRVALIAVSKWDEARAAGAPKPKRHPKSFEEIVSLLNPSEGSTSEGPSVEGEEPPPF